MYCYNSIPGNLYGIRIYRTRLQGNKDERGVYSHTGYIQLPENATSWDCISLEEPVTVDETDFHLAIYVQVDGTPYKKWVMVQNIDFE